MKKASSLAAPVVVTTTVKKEPSVKLDVPADAPERKPSTPSPAPPLAPLYQSYDSTAEWKQLMDLLEVVGRFDSETGSFAQPAAELEALHQDVQFNLTGKSTRNLDWTSHVSTIGLRASISYWTLYQLYQLLDVVVSTIDLLLCLYPDSHAGGDAGDAEALQALGRQGATSEAHRAAGQSSSQSQAILPSSLVKY